MIIDKQQDIIQVSQGRTKYITVVCKNKYTGQTYTLQEGDVIRFGVRPQFDSKYIIFKTLTSSNEVNNKYPLCLTPEDTNIPARRYFYDCSVELANGSCFDIVKAQYFMVTNSVTHKGDE